MQNDKKLRRLVKLIVESQMRKLSENYEESSTMSREEFLESVKSYGRLKETISNSGKIQHAVSEIKKMVEAAEEITLQESEGWFDNVTVNRHMKQMNEAYKVLEKTCNEIVQAQQRFESAYNDIGRVLENYYDIDM